MDSAQASASDSVLDSLKSLDTVAEHNWERKNFIEMFGPKYPNRLYYKIVNDSCITAVVRRWVRQYKQNNRSAIIALRQLFIDMAGFQDIDVKTDYNNNDLEFIHKLEHTAKYTLHLKKTFLAFPEDILLRVCKFVLLLVKFWICKEILIRGNYISRVTDFLRAMIKSNNPGLIHIGMYVTIRMISGLVVIYKQIKKCTVAATGAEANLVVSLNLSESRISNNTKCDQLAHLIRDINVKLFKECGEAVGAELMKTDWKRICIDETYVWVKEAPEVCCQEIVESFYLHCLRNKESSVRFQVLDKLRAMLLLPELKQYFSPLMNILISPIGERIYDADLEVASYAQTILMIIHNCYRKLPHKELLMLHEGVYFKNYVQFSSCGKFVINYIRQSFSLHNRNSKNVVGCLIKLYQYLEKKQMDFFVEAFIPNANEIFDFEAMLDLLDVNQRLLNDTDKFVLVSMMYEVLKQSVNGKCESRREGQECNRVAPAKIKKLVLALISQSSELIFSYTVNDYLNKKILWQILSLCLLSAEVNARLKHRLDVSEQYFDIFRASFSIVVDVPDYVLLKKVSLFLKYFMSTDSEIRRGATDLFDSKIAKYSRLYNRLRTVQPRISGHSRRPSVELLTLRMAALYEYNDLNKHFQWNQLYEKKPAESEDKNFWLICCKQWIIWASRKRTGLKKKNKLKRIRKEFQSYLVSLLADSNVCQTAFDAIADIFLDHKTKIKLKKNELVQYEKQIGNFIKVNIFEQFYEGNLKQKRDSLKKYLDLIANCLLKPGSSVFVYVHYNSHKSQFQGIMDSVLNSYRLGSRTLFLKIIIDSLQEKLRTLLTSAQTNFSSFTDLADSFNDFFVHQKHSEELVKLHCLGHIYIRNSRNYHFFNGLIQLLKKTTAADRKRILTNFMAELKPHIHEESPATLAYIKHLLK